MNFTRAFLNTKISFCVSVDSFDNIFFSVFFLLMPHERRKWNAKVWSCAEENCIVFLFLLLKTLFFVLVFLLFVFWKFFRFSFWFNSNSNSWYACVSIHYSVAWSDECKERKYVWILDSVQKKLNKKRIIGWEVVFSKSAFDWLNNM